MVQKITSTYFLSILLNLTSINLYKIEKIFNFESISLNLNYLFFCAVCNLWVTLRSTQKRHKEQCVQFKALNKKCFITLLPLSSFTIGFGSHTGTCERIACTAWAAKTLVSHCEDFNSTETLANRWCSSWGCNFWASPNCWAAALLVTALVPVSNNIKSRSNLKIF